MKINEMVDGVKDSIDDARVKVVKAIESYQCYACQNGKH